MVSVRFALLLVCLLLCAACATTQPAGDQTVDVFEQSLTEINAAVAEMKEVKDELARVEEAFTQSQFEQIQFIADRVYSARYANAQDGPTVYRDSVERHLRPAEATLPPATQAARDEIVEELRQALRDSQEDREALRLRAERLEGQATDLRAREEQLTRELEIKRGDLAVKEAHLEDTTSELENQTRVARAQAKLAEEQEARAERERQARMRTWLAAGLMSLGALLGVAGVVARALHVPGVLSIALAGGGFLFAVGWTISYVEDLRAKYAPWFDLGIGVLLIGIVGYIAYRVYQTSTKAKYDGEISTNAVAAIEELKLDDARYGIDRFKHLRPYLKQWNTDKFGNPDFKISREIEKRVIGLDLINPPGNPETSGPSLTLVQAMAMKDDDHDDDPPPATRRKVTKTTSRKAAKKTPRTTAGKQPARKMPAKKSPRLRRPPEA
ncbi:MAG: hypothetical protein ACOC3I_09580 [Verrucomicrobiota bacterium]